MEQRLVPLNAVLAMYANTTTSWPKPFSDLGYRLEALEFPVKNDDRFISVDAVGFKGSENRFHLHEAKSGTSVPAEQAQRYADADPAYLVRSVGVTVGGGALPSAQSTYVCLKEHEERILWFLSEAKVELPVISIGEDTIEALGTAFADPELAEKFSEPISIPGPPPGIIVVDADSPDDDFDQVVAPSLVAAASRSEEVVSVAHLAEMSLTYYAIYPAVYQKRLRGKVADAAIRAASADPQHWEFRMFKGANESGSVRILATPEQADPRGRTQQYQAMRGRLQAGSRRRVRPEIPGQRQFFAEESEVEQELERAGSSDSEDREEEL
jgi:hypothetical protein